MIRLQKDGYRLARPVEHGQRMVQNDDDIPRADIPPLFAEITALLEDAHEIAGLGQSSKLERWDYLEATAELEAILEQIRLNSDAIRRTLK